jgi:Zn-finger nucleic acid-binding protein
MNCPECKALMQTITYEGVEIQTCDSCGGEFVTEDQMGCIVRAREARFGKHLQLLLDDHKPKFGTPSSDSDRHLTCPACDSAMRPINYGTDTGVSVDRCENCHGMWLDHEELEKIQILMENWSDRAPGKLKLIASELEEARRQAAESASTSFSASRFSFINAVINRFLDAA